MTTNQIYQEYLTPQNLQQHMLRVAALAKIILDHWTGQPVDQEAIIQTCLFHDIAKPINFDLKKQTQFGLSPQEIDKLDQLQQRLKKNYGTNEHQVVVKICQAINLKPKAVKLVDNLVWSFIPQLINQNDLESLIPIYADMRIGPKGILPLSQRLEELETRTGKQHHHHAATLEKLIAQHTPINLNSITDERINSHFDELLNLLI